MSRLLRGLNPQQKEAVLHTKGPLLILAGAGSGKTRVVTHRIAHLVENKVCRPENILAITFTNKAANEMRERLKKICAADEMTVCTSHSLGNRILRGFYKEAGLQKNYKIIAEHERWIVLKTSLRKATKRHQYIDLPWLSGRISYAKNAGIHPSKYPVDVDKGPLVKKVYQLYEKEVARKGHVDFDDLLIKPLELLKNNQPVLEKIKRKFRYISVDEYQDTNPLQFEMIRLLAGPQNNICAVGDDDQGIYGWRGADIQNILTFKDSFPGTKTIKLERNYRSTSVILDAANAVIEKNQNRTPKKMYTGDSGGHPIEHYQADDERDEPEWIAATIKKAVKAKEMRFKDFALLFRTNAQSRIYEEEFRRARIPYRLHGGTSFFDRKEIRDIISYLNFFHNQHDEISLERMLKIPDWHVSKQSLEKIGERAAGRNITVWECLKTGKTLPVSESQQENIRLFVAFVEKYINKIKTGPLGKTVRAMIKELEYTDYLKKMKSSGKQEVESRLQNIEEFIKGIEQYDARKKGLTGFLDEIFQMTRDNGEKDRKDGVIMMTYHSSKGMEFPAVFLVGLDNEVMPSKRSVEEGGIEEERRLFYVGITRAEKRLFLSWPAKRTVYKKVRKVMYCQFIHDIPQDLLAAPIGKREKKDKEVFLKDFFSQMKKKFG